ncbi:hypothetical protein CPB83DRAFT_861531 [Crepidotus variabilis]|uniref:Uncharacterized protein n=1 Tax=Crepidotus variabilis TaxID=179855 RepID=A0A9P6E851_9AGAR|nr:hypothetical protein CPB83DRAFT_861531 [Crepidotus variabilis]
MRNQNIVFSAIAIIIAILAVRTITLRQKEAQVWRVTPTGVSRMADVPMPTDRVVSNGPLKGGPCWDITVINYCQGGGGVWDVTCGGGPSLIWKEVPCL